MAADELNDREGVETSVKSAFKRSSEESLEVFSSSLKRSKLDDSRFTTPNSKLEKANDKEDSVSKYYEDSELDMAENTTNPSSAIANTLWIEKKLKSNYSPRLLLKSLFNTGDLPNDIDDVTLWHILASIMTEPPKRKRLSDVTTFDDVIKLIKKSKKIIVLTGAGVSVSCGIPDFRSRNGIYARLSVDYPDLPDPQAMFDINYFRRNPKPFFKFAKEIYPGLFSPSTAHRFIGALEASGRLLRNYTQNIDTLEPLAHITQLIQCHGSFSTATCMRCRLKVDAEVIRDDVMNQVIPMCPNCPSNSIDDGPPKSPTTTNNVGVCDAKNKNVDVEKKSDDAKKISDDATKISDDAKKISDDATKISDDAKKMSDDTKENSEEGRSEGEETKGGSSWRGLMMEEVVEKAILKPDIVFFGESLSEEFHRCFEDDKGQCDLLIVMGSSLKVKPVAIIPDVLPAKVPQVLINRESLPHMHFDVELLGDCDAIVRALCQHLGDEGVFGGLAAGGEAVTARKDASASKTAVVEDSSKADEKNFASPVSSKIPSTESSTATPPTSLTTHTTASTTTSETAAATTMPSTTTTTKTSTTHNASGDKGTATAGVNKNFNGAEKAADDDDDDDDDDEKDNAGDDNDDTKNNAGDDDSCKEKELLRVDVPAFLNGRPFSLLSARKYVFPGAEVFQKVLNGSPCSSSSSSSPSDDEDDDDDDVDEDGGEDECEENVFRTLQAAQCSDARMASAADLFPAPLSTTSSITPSNTTTTTDSTILSTHPSPTTITPPSCTSEAV